MSLLKKFTVKGEERRMKKLLPVLTTLLLITALGGCVMNKYSDDLFTDEVWIAQEGDTYSYIRGDIEVKSLELTLDFTGFYGKHTVWVIEAGEESLLMARINLADTLRGLYKICLVTPGKQVIPLISEPGDHTLTIPLAPGRQVITLVGYQASGDMTMQLIPPSDIVAVTIRPLY
jgi:hypothetical protein